MRSLIVVAVAVLCACGSSSTTEPIAAEPGTSKDDAGNTVLADGGVVGPDGGRITPGADPVEQSGTRLKVKTMTGADGSRIAQGLHDTQIDADCGFATASDGSTRCLPIFGATPASPTYFADAACTKRLVVMSKGCASASPFSYFGESAAATCTVTRYHVFRIAAPHTADIYNSSPCVSVGASAPALRATYDFYGLGDELAPTTFVAGAAGLQ